MSDNTKIEWTDATWNPITGCTVVSAGCKHCYAMKLAGTRMRNTPSRNGLTVQTKAGPVWNGQIRINHEWLAQPLQWKRPRMIFVCAHGDLFHESVNDTTIAGIFGIMAACPQHTFQVLTKRADRMRRWFETFMAGGHHGAKLHEAAKGLMGYEHPKRPAIQDNQPWPLPNVWLGVSTEDQETFKERAQHLLACPAAVRWISAEPLLGRIIAGDALGACNCQVEAMEGAGMHSPTCAATRPRIDWVVAGGESGHGARPMNPDWPRALRDQCAAAGVPYFFKQWGEYAPSVLSRSQGCVDHTNGRYWPIADPTGRGALKRLGKKAAGRLLDGIEHNGMPT